MEEKENDLEVYALIVEEEGNKYLQAFNPVQRVSKPIKLRLLRESTNYYVTERMFALGIVGTSKRDHLHKEVRWHKGSLCVSGRADDYDRWRLVTNKTNLKCFK